MNLNKLDMNFYFVNFRWNIIKYFIGRNKKLYAIILNPRLKYEICKSTIEKKDFYAKNLFFKNFDSNSRFKKAITVNNEKYELDSAIMFSQSDLSAYSLHRDHPSTSELNFEGFSEFKINEKGPKMNPWTIF